MPMSMPPDEANRYGLPATYWETVMDERQRNIVRLVDPIPQSAYEVSWFLNSLEATLAAHAKGQEEQGGSFELNPDFQRGHVWTPEQQVAYVESFLRGAAPATILFNCPSFSDHARGDLNRQSFVCVDGLQRLTALRGFIAGTVKPFGLGVEAFEKTNFDPTRPGLRVTVKVYSIANRADLLRFYLALNTGGTIHTADELNRVRALITTAEGT